MNDNQGYSDTKEMKLIATDMDKIKESFYRLEKTVEKLSKVFEDFLIADTNRKNFELQHQKERERDGLRFERLEIKADDTNQTLHKWLNRGVGVWAIIFVALGGSGAYFTSAVGKLIEIENRLSRIETKINMEKASTVDFIKEPFEIKRPPSPPTTETYQRGY